MYNNVHILFKNNIVILFLFIYGRLGEKRGILKYGSQPEVLWPQFLVQIRKPLGDIWVAIK